MADEPDVVLILLCRIDERTQRMADDLQDLEVRATAVEEGVAGVNRRIDRLELRIDRLDQRIDRMREFYVWDPDGNLLRFGQPIVPQDTTAQAQR